MLADLSTADRKQSHTNTDQLIIFDTLINYSTVQTNNNTIIQKIHNKTTTH